MLTDKKRTNKHIELHQFQKEPSGDGDLSSLSSMNLMDKLFSSQSPETEMLTDKQTDKNRTNEHTELHQF